MQDERKFVSDQESYEVFVGSISPEELVDPYDGSINQAIDIFDNWHDDEAPPSWLKASLYRYVEDALDGEED